MNVIVVGGGAAGLTRYVRLLHYVFKRINLLFLFNADSKSAIWAASNGSRVLVLERMKEPGKKILMSGGTRCNVLPVVWQPKDYFSSSTKSVKVSLGLSLFADNPHQPVLKHWPIEDCKRWFEEEIGLKMEKEIETNKWFPASNSAREVESYKTSD